MYVQQVPGIAERQRELGIRQDCVPNDCRRQPTALKGNRRHFPTVAIPDRHGQTPNVSMPPRPSEQHSVFDRMVEKLAQAIEARSAAGLRHDPFAGGLDVPLRLVAHLDDVGSLGGKPLAGPQAEVWIGARV